MGGGKPLGTHEAEDLKIIHRLPAARLMQINSRPCGVIEVNVSLVDTTP